MQALPLLIPVFFLLGTWAIGRGIERRHYRSIHARERRQLQRPALTSAHLPDDQPVRAVSLAVGSVVVSADYFKNFLAGLRALIGGEMHSLSPVLDRARREAILRMKESCPQADLFLNLRLQTSQIADIDRKGIPMVEVLAFATAVKLGPAPASESREPSPGDGPRVRSTPA